MEGCLGYRFIKVCNGTILTHFVAKEKKFNGVILGYAAGKGKIECNNRFS
jgi:hypothetical protein